ncbi:MAG TPA: hypothetical protein VGG94_07020 [Chthoniobacterales bacterium]
MNGGIAPFVNIIHHPDDEFEKPMTLTKLTRFAFPIFCGAILSCATAQAQTGNTGGSSGGTGGGQSGLGSGPAASVPSTGGNTFTGNPDANPYEKAGKDSFITGPAPTSATTTTEHKSQKHASKTSKSTSSKPKKKASPTPAASASPAASPSR